MRRVKTSFSGEHLRISQLVWYSLSVILRREWEGQVRGEPGGPLVSHFSSQLHTFAWVDSNDNRIPASPLLYLNCRILLFLMLGCTLPPRHTSLFELPWSHSVVIAPWSHLMLFLKRLYLWPLFSSVSLSLIPSIGRFAVGFLKSTWIITRRILHWREIKH